MTEYEIMLQLKTVAEELLLCTEQGLVTWAVSPLGYVCEFSGLEFCVRLDNNYVFSLRADRPVAFYMETYDSSHVLQHLHALAMASAENVMPDLKRVHAELMKLRGF